MTSWSLNENVIVGAGGAHFDFQNSSHLQPLAPSATCSPLQPLGSHLLQPLEQVSAKCLPSGCKWLTGQVAASGCKWLLVAASGWRGKWLQVAAKWLQVAASGCKRLQAADGASAASGCPAADGPSGCKWLQVAASGCQVLSWKTRRRMARERRGAGSSLVSMETPF